MPSEWSEVRLAEVTTVLGDGLHGTPEYDDQGDYYFINGNNLSDGQIVFNEKTRRVGEAEYQRHRKNLNDRTILVSINGTLGNIALYRGEKVVLGKSACYFNVRPGVDKHFVRYVIASPDFREYINTLATGSTIKNVSLRLMRDFVFQLRTLKQQESISATLSALDDRIDLLRQTNTTLESIAQALFKSWFIDFDPVRAKQAGREPEGMDAATAALFPAEFEESALGLIPKGWRAATLAEHVEAERGLSYKGAGLCSADEGLPMHNLNSILEGGGYKYAGLKFYKGDFKDRHVAIAGDIIVANTEQGHDHRLIGFPAIIPARYPRAIYSHHIYRVCLRPESQLTPHTLYYTLMTPAVREQIIGCANGSTVNMLKVAGLEIPRFVCPPAPAAQAFESVVQALRAQVETNVTRLESLSGLRDTLLPRLISGKLRLPEAQEQLEDALA